MAIWRGQQVQDATQTDFHLKFKFFGYEDKDESTRLMQAHIAKARAVMTYVHFALPDRPPPPGTVNYTFPPHFYNTFDYLFLLNGKKMSGLFWRVIRDMAQVIKIGLTDPNLTVKVSPNSGGNPRQLGYVTAHGSLNMLAMYDPHLVPRDGHTRGIARLGPRQQIMVAHYGSIHIKDSQLRASPIGPVRTLIHEATHKFASTVDFTYLNTNDWRPVYHEVITAEQALNNADTLAWFFTEMYIAKKMHLAGVDYSRDDMKTNFPF